MKDGIMQIRLADILQPYCRCFRQNTTSICSHTGRCGDSSVPFCLFIRIFPFAGAEGERSDACLF